MGASDIMKVLKKKWLTVKQIAKLTNTQPSSTNRVLFDLFQRNEVQRRKVKKTFSQKATGFQKKHKRVFHCYEYNIRKTL